MTAHELAKKLLEGPDIPVCFEDFECAIESREVVDLIVCIDNYYGANHDDNTAEIIKLCGP